MSSSDRFAPGAGRERPQHQPTTIGCASCGATLSIQDERAALVVCSYCGSHLELDQNQLKVIGAGPDREWQFSFELGADFRWRGVRYEVVARMALTEEAGDPPTLQYLLYHPAQGSFWLAEYQGNWDLSEPTHVMPKTGPFALATGDVLQTHDGGRWLAVESGVTRLAYVDGTLPWVAKIGDMTHYAELVAADGSGETYEVEASGDELEYGRGRLLSVAEVRSASGRQDLPPPVVPRQDVVGRKRMFRRMLAIAALAVVVNGLLFLVAAAKGHTVLDQRFSADEITGEVLSQPFQLAKPDVPLKIELQCPRLDNAWMAADVAVVQGEDDVVAVEDADISYYHGVEGGESWSEGSRTSDVYLRVPTTGPHRLLLHAVSGMGETETASASHHELRVRVIAGAARPVFPGVVAGLAGICLLITAAAYQKWRKGDDDEEDD